MKFEKDFAVAYIQQQNMIRSIIEVLLITSLLLLFLWWVKPDDPVGFFGTLPWVILAPLLCGLFYGGVYSIVSLGVVFGFLYTMYPQDSLTGPAIREYLLWSVSITAVTGFFSSYWLTRIQHVERLNEYVRTHLETLSRDYYTLRVSHDRIEQSYIVKPISVRDVFYQIQQEIIKNKIEDQSNEKAANMLLGLFSQYCSIDRAAFCSYDNKMDTIKTITFLEREFSIKREDPLIQKSINKKITTFVAINELENKSASDYLAIIPLLDLKRTLIGFIVIKEMPFWSLNFSSLEILSVFAAYYGFQWSIIEQVTDLLKVYPHCPPDFLRELECMVRLKKHHRVESTLACILVPHSSRQKNIVYTLTNYNRTLDRLWIASHQKTTFIITLMPLTNVQGVLGYKNRMSNLLKNTFGLEIGQEGLLFRFQSITKESSLNQLKNLFEDATHGVD